MLFPGLWVQEVPLLLRPSPLHPQSIYSFSIAQLCYFLLSSHSHAFLGLCFCDSFSLSPFGLLSHYPFFKVISNIFFLGTSNILPDGWSNASSPPSIFSWVWGVLLRILVLCCCSSLYLLLVLCGQLCSQLLRSLQLLAQYWEHR